MTPAQLMLRDPRLTFPMSEAEKLAAFEAARRMGMIPPTSALLGGGRAAATPQVRFQRSQMAGGAPPPAANPHPGSIDMPGAKVTGPKVTRPTEPALGTAPAAASPAASKGAPAAAGKETPAPAATGKEAPAAGKEAPAAKTKPPKGEELNQAAIAHGAAGHAEGSLGRGFWENAMPHMLRAGPLRWAAPGAAIGALAGAVDPGTDEDGHRRGTLGGMLHGSARGALVGGAAGSVAKMTGKSMIAPHQAAVRGGAPLPSAGHPAPATNAPVAAAATHGAAPAAAAEGAVPNLGLIDHGEAPVGGNITPFAGKQIKQAPQPYTGNKDRPLELKENSLLARLQPAMKFGAVYNTNGNIHITPGDMTRSAPRAAVPIAPGTPAQPTIVPGKPQMSAPLTSAPVVNNTLPPAPASPNVYRKNMPQLAGLRAPAGPALQPR